MRCRIGMATNVKQRVNELIARGLVTDNPKCKIIKANLTYEEANTIEKRARLRCGPHCKGQVGGMYKGGKVWSVYRLDW